MNNENLDEIRKKIDELDNELVKIIEERMKMVTNVAKYKKENNKNIFDKKREKEVIDKNLNRVVDKKLQKYIKNILEDLMDVSKQYQRDEIGENIEIKQSLDFSNKKIGYQGVEGSYSYEVLNKLKAPLNNLKKYNTFDQVTGALNSEEIDLGILPIENTIAGEVRETFDLLLDNDIYIIEEIVHKIDHNLLGIHGTKIEDIKEVYSHVQGLTQCSKYLKNRKNWNLIPYFNTAISAKYISEQNDKTKVAIASKSAQEIYDLEILEENLNDNSENYTKFVLLSKKLESKENSNKISLVYSTKHEAGYLFSTIEVFNKYKLNLTNIKSRPISGKPWEYNFYIDFEGNLNDENVKKAIKDLRLKTTFFKILGNYFSEIL